MRFLRAQILMALAKVEKNEERHLILQMLLMSSALAQVKEIDAKDLASSAAPDIEMAKIGEEWRKRRASDDEATKAKRMRRMNACYFGP